MTDEEEALHALLLRLCGPAVGNEGEGGEEEEEGAGSEAASRLGQDDLLTLRACAPRFEAQPPDQASEFWRGAVQAGVSFVALTKALGRMLRDADLGLSWRACTFYSTLLRLPGCPVGTNGGCL